MNIVTDEERYIEMHGNIGHSKNETPARVVEYETLKMKMRHLEARWSEKHELNTGDGETICEHCGFVVSDAPPRTTMQMLYTHCPGYKTEGVTDRIRYRFVIDFINGEWIEGTIAVQAARVALGLPAHPVEEPNDDTTAS